MMVVVLVGRRLLGQPPVFRGEFIWDDAIVLLAIGCAAAPSGVRLLGYYLVTSAFCLLMAIITWKVRSRAFPAIEAVFPTVFIILLGAYAAALFVLGLRKFLRSSPTASGS